MITKMLKFILPKFESKSKYLMLSTLQRLEVASELIYSDSSIQLTIKKDSELK